MEQDIFIADIYDTGKTGIFFLKRFWSKEMAKKKRIVPQDNFTEEWNLDTALLDALGIGIEQAFSYFSNDKQDFRAFEEWVIHCNNGVLPAEKIQRFHLLLNGTYVNQSSAANDPPVLFEDDLQFWDTNGYVILHDAVSPENCIASEQLIWQYLGMDKNDPSTWYQSHKDKQGIMVQLFQHPVLQSNRESKRIRKAYEQLWGTDDLWLNTDRVGFNPPETENWKFPGPGLHWDVSLALPIPFGLQGILYLTDTVADQGAFTLVPGFQHRIENWIQHLPAGADPRTEDLHALGAVPLAGKAGDLIIWHQALPHGSCPNTTNKPRIVQYINLQPVNREIKHQWK